MVEVAEEVGDADMELSILRMTGPRLQSAMFGAMLLAAWVDFLQLADVLLRECSACGVETLVVDLHRVQQRMQPTLEALTSVDAERVEEAATAMPELMGQLTREVPQEKAEPEEKSPSFAGTVEEPKKECTPRWDFRGAATQDGKRWTCGPA
jgi:hypothetical protein